MNRIITLSILLLVLALLSFSNTLAKSNVVEKKFREAGLINIHAIDSSIQVDLVNYDPEKNCFRENFYDGLNKAYLRKDVAVRLSYFFSKSFHAPKPADYKLHSPRIAGL
ncbi:MAG: hypothetical protein FP814_12410 [Desulfobacterium sp.]|nr:hypothetical protein [Desulfobacterium sp.]MBU3947151.1 hypothetical protein [Pseudomonadota bacterium]MBU4010416.1 hypothetical protein [Pseudomonadota bacterium]MBU4037647.1 hypothetical protein [Pseudomonadota bacterium]